MFTDEQRERFEALNSKAAKHMLKAEKAKKKASERRLPAYALILSHV